MKRVFIANRGAVASRIIRACQTLGVETCAPYTKEDEDWAPRHEADMAVCLGAGSAKDTYLDKKRLLQFCADTGADAVHPGYGFLSENADFAQEVSEAGLTFIGPSPSIIALMADKGKAKSFAEEAGIPTIPGHALTIETDTQIAQLAQEIGFPVMLKAVAGGGGMGIRLVEDATGLPDALSSVRHEALASFGDERLILEKFLPSVRHIEVQVIGDQHGNVVHAYDRECSVQRRRQKVLEEAPAPRLPAALRKAMTDAAVSLAQRANYVGLGTVEFVVAQGAEEPGDFYFLEMNTRLQVEHGVTEEVTGLDLVETQIRVARGEALRVAQADITTDGHAIQARLCAEDPENNLLPSSGRVLELKTPQPPIRWESGLSVGANVSGFYDSLIAKLIARAPSRDAALAQLAEGLRSTKVLGMPTNAPFLSALLNEPNVIRSTADTRFVDREFEEIMRRPKVQDELPLTAIAAVLFVLEDSGFGKGKRVQPFTRMVKFEGDRAEALVTIDYQGSYQFRAEVNGQTFDIRAVQSGNQARITIDEIERAFTYAITADTLHLVIPGGASTTLTRKVDDWRAAQEGSEGDLPQIQSSLTGLVIRVLTEEGAEVEQGDKLMVLESMKMEHSIVAPISGTISGLTARAGQSVQSSELLATIIAPATNRDAS